MTQKNKMLTYPSLLNYGVGHLSIRKFHVDVLNVLRPESSQFPQIRFLLNIQIKSEFLWL